MDFFQNRYYGPNRLIFRIVGLWPYDHWRSRIPKVAFSIFLVLFGIGALIAKLFMEDLTVTFFTGLIQLLIPGIMVFINTLYMCYHSNKVRMCIEHIADDWNLHEPCDLEIMKRYAELTRSFTLLTTTCCSVFGLTQVVRVVSPNSNVIGRGSESQAPEPQIVPFADNPELRIYAICFASTVVIVANTMLIAIASMFCTYAIHACVMFHILGQRFESVFDSMDQNFICNKVHPFSGFFRLIFYHIRAIEFVGHVNSLYGPLFMIETGMIIGVISCAIYVLLQSFGNDFNLFVSTAGTCIGLLVSLFVLSVAGQILVDQSTGIVGKVYESRWYNAPPTIQRSIALIMMRGQTECGIGMTKTVSASYEMFLAVVKLSTSYFMVLKSLQA